ncbi:MAG: hypothetical protein ACOCR8_00205 [Desulfosalsimonas sp.]
MKLQTTDDLIVHFECGHSELNPKPSSKRNKFLCPKCGPQAAVKTKVLCQGCGKILVEKAKQGRRKIYCESCRQKRNKENAQSYRDRNFTKEVEIEEPEYSLNEIAQEIGVTKQRAGQIFNLAIKKFRDNWRKMYGTEPPVDCSPDPAEWGEKYGWTHGGLE